MKKLTALCLTLTLTCSLAACSHPSSENSTFASQPNAESTAPAPERTQKPSEQPSDAPTQAPTCLLYTSGPTAIQHISPAHCI